MLSPELRASAVEWLKAGRLPMEVYSALVRSGASPEEANACVLELVALKQAAEARDPARLRADAARMLFYGASKDEVARYFAGLGIAPEHAGPEIDKIVDGLRGMIACERCGQPSPPDKVYFDPSGIRICRLCQSGNQARVATQRAIESEQNERNGHLALGVLGVLALSPRVAARGFINANAAQPAPGPTTCPRCQVSSGLHRNMLPPQVQAMLHPAVTYACSRCGAAIA
jgi:hypothetical protein